MKPAALPGMFPTGLESSSPYEAHQEDARRLTAKAKVLQRLQQGEATNDELNAICFRFGGRLHELRKEGHRIETASEKKGLYVYRWLGQE